MKKFNLLFKIILFSTIIIIGANLASSTVKATVENVTVKKLVTQNLVSGSADDLSTEIRYLVVTNKGTFLCESSLLSGKFNNSEIFYSLKEDSTYHSFVVAGLGKSFFSDYKNLISVK